jgi:hypothetical protein
VEENLNEQVSSIEVIDAKDKEIFDLQFQLQKTFLIKQILQEKLQIKELKKALEE